MIFIFSSLAPNSTLFILLDFVSFIIGHWLAIACSYTRDSSEDDDEKTKIHNFVQLSFTKIFKHLFSTITSSHRNLSHHIATLVISLSLFSSSTPSSSHDCIGGIFLIRNKDLSYPLSPWRVASLRKNGSTHHQATQRTTRDGYLDHRLGGGEPKAKRKHCTRTPFFSTLLFLLVFQLFREGKVTYVPVVLETELAGARAHTHTNTITSIFMTSQWRRHCVSQLELVFAHGWVSLCVCERAIESSQQRVWWKIFNFKMATDVFSQLVCLGSLVMGKRFANDERRLGWFGFPSTLIARLNSTSTEIESLFPNQKKKEI